MSTAENTLPLAFDMEPYRALYPFASHFFEHKGLRMHYLDEGKGETIVMLHGNPTWSFYFRELVKGLRGQYRVIVPDHIGCGLSDKPDDSQYSYRLKQRIDDVEALLDHLQIKDKITLLAHDWGGMIAMGFARRHTDRIKRLVMLNTASFMLPEGKSLPFRLWLVRMIRPFAAFAVRGLNLFSRAALWMCSVRGLSKPVQQALLAPYDSWAHRIAVLRFVQDIPLKPGDPSFEICRDVEAHTDTFQHLPLLLCWGERDFVFDMEFLAEWERRFPKAEVHRFPNAGHYVLEDASEEILPLVRDFLQRHPI